MDLEGSSPFTIMLGLADETKVRLAAVAACPRPKVKDDAGLLSSGTRRFSRSLASARGGVIKTTIQSENN